MDTHGEQDLDPVDRDAIFSRFDFIHSDVRGNIARMQQQGIDLTHAIGVGHTTCYHNNKKENHEEAEHVVTLAGATEAALVDGSLALLKRQPNLAKNSVKP